MTSLWKCERDRLQPPETAETSETLGVTTLSAEAYEDESSISSERRHSNEAGRRRRQKRRQRRWEKNGNARNPANQSNGDGGNDADQTWGRHEEYQRGAMELVKELRGKLDLEQAANKEMADQCEREMDELRQSIEASTNPFYRNWPRGPGNNAIMIVTLTL